MVVDWGRFSEVDRDGLCRAWKGDEDGGVGGSIGVVSVGDAKFVFAGFGQSGRKGGDAFSVSGIAVMMVTATKRFTGYFAFDPLAIEFRFRVIYDNAK